MKIDTLLSETKAMIKNDVILFGGQPLKFGTQRNEKY